MQVNKELLEIIMDALPLDICLIDQDDRVVWWNRPEARIFNIPPDVMGKDVRDCHPEKTIDTIDKMLGLMKEGERDVFKMWVDVKHPEEVEKVLITYKALRDESGEYVGCIEIDQAVEEMRSLEGEKRISDIL